MFNSLFILTMLHIFMLAVGVRMVGRGIWVKYPNMEKSRLKLTIPKS